MLALLGLVLCNQSQDGVEHPATASQRWQEGQNHRFSVVFARRRVSIVQKISVALSQGALFLVRWLFSGLSWTASTGISTLLACPISSLGYKRQKENPGDWVPYNFSVALVPSPPAFSSLSRRNSAKSIYSIFLEAKVFDVLPNYYLVSRWLFPVTVLWLDSLMDKWVIFSGIELYHISSICVH